MAESEKRFPHRCPSCSHQLSVKRLICTECGTEVEGLFSLPPMANLSQEEQEFILRFVKASGSLKEMAKIMKRSYPLVRNYLDGIIIRLNEMDQIKKDPKP
ncbi:MAG: DUF2089 family protein [Bacteroidia bacterium]